MKFEQKMQSQQKQVQKLAMTQQLQQSIQILQFNREELQLFLETKMLENPLIDVEVKVDGEEFDYKISTDKSRSDQIQEDNLMNQIPDCHYSLFEFLLDQIHLNYRDTFLRKLLLFLVEYVDVNGYMTISLEEAMVKSDTNYIEILDALTLLQQLDPAGVGARDLQESLMLQTERNNEAPVLTYVVLEEDFDPLVNREWQKIASKYQISLQAIQEIFDFIQTLSPYPGALFNETKDLYIQPDLIVTEEEGVLKVRSKKTGLATLNFQKNYYDNLKKVDDQEVQAYMKEKKNEVDWIQKSLKQREDTILKVGTEIVKQQKDFFTQLDHPLKPMTFKEIADRLAIHESTVSRTVNGKYLQTAFGSYELRTFFPSGLEYKRTNEEISNIVVKERLKRLIDQENKAKPLSDQKLVNLLAEQQIVISRRTVAKYREAMQIPSSAKRKRYDE